MILVQLVQGLSTGQFFFILVLLDAERNEISNILCSLVHNTLFEGKDNANFANSTNYANYFYRIIREISRISAICFEKMENRKRNGKNGLSLHLSRLTLCRSATTDILLRKAFRALSKPLKSAKFHHRIGQSTTLMRALHPPQRMGCHDRAWRGVDCLLVIGPFAGAQWLINRQCPHVFVFITTRRR